MQREAAQKPASTPKATARAMSVDDMEVAAQRSDKGGTVARPPPFEETKEPPGAQFQEAHTLPQAYARNGNDPMSPNAFQTTEVKTAQTDVLCEIPGCLPHRHKRRPRLKDEGPEPKSGDSEDFGPKAIKGKRPAGEAKEAVPEAPPVRSEEPLHQLAMRMMRGMAPCSVYTRHMLTRRTITDVVLGEDVILWLIGDDKHPEVTDTASAIMLGQQLLDGDYMRRLSRRGFVPRLDHLRKGKNVFRGGRAIFEFVVENCSRFLLHVVPVGCHGGVRLDEASRYLTLTLGRQKQMTEIVERGTLKEGKGLRLQRFVFGVNDPDAEHLQVEGYVYRFGRGDKFMGTAQASLSRLDILGGNSDSTASRIERWQNSLSQSAENRRRSHRAQAAARPMSGRLERLQALFVDPVAGLRREGIPEGQLPDFEVDPRDPDLAPPVYYPFRARDGGPGHGALSIGMCMKLERVDHKRRGGAAHGDPGRFGFDRNLRLHAHIFEVKGVSERGTKPMFMRLGQAMGIRYNVKVRAVTKNGDIETDYTSKSPRGDAAWPVLKTGDPEGELLELELKHCNRNIDCVNFMVIQKLPTDTELSSIILASLEVRLKDIPIVEDTSLDETMESHDSFERHTWSGTSSSPLLSSAYAPPARHSSSDSSSSSAAAHSRRRQFLVRTPSMMRSMGMFPEGVSPAWLPLSVETSRHALKHENGNLRVALWLSEADSKLLSAEIDEPADASGMTEEERRQLPPALPLECTNQEILVGLTRLKAAMIGSEDHLARARAALEPPTGSGLLTPLYKAFYNELNFKNVQITPWRVKEGQIVSFTSSILERDIAYTMPRSALVAENRVFVKQTLEVGSANVLCLRIDIRTPEVPYGSTFVTHLMLVFKRSPASPSTKVDFNVTADVSWINGGPPGFIKAQIRSGTVKEVARTWGAFAGLVSGASQGKRKRKAEVNYTALVAKKLMLLAALFIVVSTMCLLMGPHIAEYAPETCREFLKHEEAWAGIKSFWYGLIMRRIMAG